jgi:tetratricopeptide (TPR) repeat protein
MVPLAVSGLARAQQPAPETPAEAHTPPSPDPPEPVDRARALFQQGMQAAEEGRWADALPSFEESYALSGERAALYNVGATLRALGRHVEARDALRRVLADERPLDPALRQEVEAMLADEEARVATLEVTGGAEIPSLRLQLDARALTLPGTWPLELSLDPGLHVLEASAPGRIEQRWEGRLGSGERRTVALELPLVPRGEEVWESPWFWVITVAILAGGGVLAGVLARDAAQLQPQGGVPVLRL